MVLFKNDLDWVSIAEYIIALVIFTKGKHQEALEVYFYYLRVYINLFVKLILSYLVIT